MKKTILALACAAAAALPAAAQTKLNAYFASDYTHNLNAGASPQNSIGNVRGGLILAGTLTPQFSYTLEVRMNAEGAVEFDQAWAGWVWSELFRIKLGVFLVPFGVYNRNSRPFQTVLVAEPEPYGVNHPVRWREIGALAEGRWGPFDYAAYIGNGLSEDENLASGQRWADENTNKGWGVRLGASLSAELNAGFSYYRGKYDRADSRWLTMTGGDASWRTNNIYLLAEYSRAELENPAGFERGLAEGYFVKAAVMFGGYSPYVLYSQSSYNDPFHGAGVVPPIAAGAGISRETTRWTAGVKVSLHPSFAVKIEYDIPKSEGDASSDRVVRAQAAIFF